MCTSEEINLMTNIAAGFKEWEYKSEDEPCVDKVFVEKEKKSVTFQEMTDEEFIDRYNLSCGQPIILEEEEEEEIDIPCGQQIPTASEEMASVSKGHEEMKLTALKQVSYKPPETVLVDHLFHTPSYAIHPLVIHQPLIPLPSTKDQFEKIGKYQIKNDI